MQKELIKKGCTKKQIIEGIPTLTYGWVDKRDRTIFWSKIGFHSKIECDDTSTYIRTLERTIRVKLASLTRELISDLRYPIFSVDIPTAMLKNRNGFITVEVMIKSKSDIPVEVIEDYNGRIVDMLLDIEGLTIFKSNKY